LVNRDFEALADLYVRMGFIKAGTDVKPIVRGLQDALPDVLDAPVSELNVKNVASRLGDVMYTFPFALPPFYVAIIRCLGVLEGVAIQVDPGFRIVGDAAQKTNLNLIWWRRWRRRNLVRLDAVGVAARESTRLVGETPSFDAGQRRVPVRRRAVTD